MLPIRKILCPTDFSEPSYEALKAAEELTLYFSAELYLVNVVNPIPAATTTSDAMSFNVSLYQQELEKSAQKSLQELIDKRVSKKLRVHPIVAYGSPADEIVRIANEENIDLIVIATHGRTGWRHLVSGSVTEKVVRIASHPVLTIRTPKKTAAA